jgi:hypothetical protein
MERRLTVHVQWIRFKVPDIPRLSVTYLFAPSQDDVILYGITSIEMVDHKALPEIDPVTLAILGP